MPPIKLVSQLVSVTVGALAAFLRPGALDSLPRLAALVPGLRSGRGRAAAPLEATHPATARVLRTLQRDRAARFTLSTACAGAMAIEHGAEHNLLIHYLAPEHGAVTVAGGWLGAGRRHYIWLPLRPTLVWVRSPNDPASETPHTLTTPQIEALAADLHAGLESLGERHVLEHFLPASPIPDTERRATLSDYAAFMQAHGWQVAYDEALTHRSLKRTDASTSPQGWSVADREVLARLEALVAEALKGVRPSSRILYQAR